MLLVMLLVVVPVMLPVVLLVGGAISGAVLRDDTSVLCCVCVCGHYTYARVAV